MNKARLFVLFVAAVIAATLIAEPARAQNQNGAGGGQQNPPGKKSKRPARMHGEIQRASKLVGYTVENENGEVLGSVKDLIVDIHAGRVDFVIVSSGGFAGLNVKLRAVPATALSLATTLEKTLALDIGVEQWKKAPLFDKSQLDRLSNPAQARWLSQYYGQPWPPASRTAATNRPLTPTGREPDSAADLQLAKEVMGRKVLTTQGKHVGKITDLLVDLKNPDLMFALLEPGTYIGSGGRAAKGGLFAVPLRAFVTGAKGGNFVCDLTPGEFEQAQPLNATSWETASPGDNSPRVFRYQEP